MSSSAVDVEVRLKMRDGATAGIKAVSQTAQQEAAKTATATEKAAQKAAEATQKSTARQRSSYEKLSQAREVLGVRSERAIQREIQQTEAAYNRLKASGTLSWQQQAAAADQMRQKVTQLTNEMGKLTTAQKAYAGVKFAAAGVAGAAAAAYTLKAPATAAMSFDERLGLLSNTAFAEYGKDGRKLGEAQIRKAVEKAIGTGMTRDAAMDALEKLIADNQVGGVAGALDLLPYIGKVSTGSGSTSRDVAAMMGGFIGSGYAKDAEGAKRLLGISSAAATAGAFEKNDMAKHLPSLLPIAKTAGLTGEEGFKKLLVLLQQARTTAGSSDEAANNVKNLLSKLASNDTATDFKKAGRGDLYQHLMDQRAKGIDPLTAWQNVIDSEIAKNPNLKPAIAKLQGAKTKEEQDAAIEALNGMAEGQSMGKFFQDMQAKGALFGLRNKEVGQKVEEALRLSGSIVDTDYESMADRAGVKTRVAKERMDMASMTAMDSLTPAIGKAAEAFADLASKHPLLVGTTTLATTALGALAGAAGLASVAMGGKGLPGGGAIGKAAAWATASKVGQGAMRMAKVGGIAGIASTVGGYALEKGFGEESAISRYGSSALNGAALGATVGSIVPVLGTGVGAAIGGGLGLAWEGIKDLLKPAEQKPVDVNAKMTVGLAPGLVLQGQSMQASGGNVQMNTGNVWNGAP